jgi:biopolymer transport protein TolR
MPKVHDTGGSGGGRRARGHRVATTLAEINVVPLVDVMLVLLIIFMVTAPMMQQGMEVNLPQARNARAVDVGPITITIPAGFGNSRVVQLEKDEIRVDILQERVRQAMLAREQKSVLIRADRSISVQDLLTVTDELKAAGVEKVGVSSQPVAR